MKAALILRTPNERPSPAELEAAAERVRQLGLAVERVGRRHLTVSGKRSTLARALGVFPVEGKRIEIEAINGPLAELFSAIEMASEPESF